MKAKTRITTRRIKPRTFGGALLVLALTGESYLMSQHNKASAREEPMPPAAAVAIAPELTPSDPSHALAPADAGKPAHGAGCSSSSQLRPNEPACDSPQSKLLPSAKPGPVADPTVVAPTSGSSDDRAAVLKAVAPLELQSVSICGVRRSCNISNVPCVEGQQIDGFTVEMIAKGAVTVSRGIYRFELTLSH